MRSTTLTCWCFSRACGFTHVVIHFPGTVIRRVTLRWCSTDPMHGGFTFLTTPIYYAIRRAAWSLRPRRSGADRIMEQKKCVGRWFVLHSLCIGQMAERLPTFYFLLPIRNHTHYHLMDLGEQAIICLLLKKKVLLRGPLNTTNKSS